MKNFANLGGRALFNTGVASAVLGLALAATPAMAQEADADGEGELIVVTGSRIAQPQLQSASPLQILDAENIDSAGNANVQELLLENPAFGTPGISRTNSNFSTASAGVSTVDLRNLGSARTLVLVDGRRFVAGVPGSSAVDLNSIPTQFIERIDILTGGASAVYGSDAVAGVVNIIYKKNFEGIEASGQYGISDEGDDRRLQANLTIGGNFADDKGNLIAYIGYSKDGAVFSRDRARSAVDQFSTLLLNGNEADTFNPTRPFFSSFAPQGRFFRAPGVTAGTFNAGGNFITGFSTNGTATRAADGFNRNGERTIAIPTERYLFSVRGSYEVNSNISAFMEGTYASTATRTVLEPFPLDSADLFPATGGFFNVESNVNGALVANPFVPTALLGLLSDNDGDGLRDVAFTRRLSDVANRGNVADRNLFRIVAGLEGSVFGGWKWDAYYSYGQVSEAQVSSGQFNVVSFRNALNTTFIDGQHVCADANARAEGCVPANVFGRNTISPDALRYINAPGFLATFTTQQLAGANLSGELFDLWGAGKAGLAVGVEYRKEFSRSEFDPLQQAGLNGGNAIPRTEGGFDVKEAYGEFRLPILTDKPFFKEFTFRAAGRVSDYSTIGRTFSWNLGGEWAPVEDVRFRLIRARSTRAPNINELFSPPSQTFPTGLQDPCVGVTATTAGTLGTVCRSYVGVAANIAANGAFTLNQSDLQGISGFDRGNPALNEERGDSWTAGVVINPRSINALKNFGLTIDYFDIKIKGAIVSTPRQFILDQCFTQGVQSFCNFLTRRPTPLGSNSAGSLDEIDSGSTNSGGIRTQGIDVGLTYRQNLENWGLKGNLSLNAAYTHVLKGFVVPLPGSAKDHFAGEVGASKNKATFSANYSLKKFGLSVTNTYIGSAYLDDQFTGFKPGDAGSEPFRIGSKIYTDAQFKFSPADTFEVYVGVDNLFDTTPPPIISGLPGNSTGTETDAGTYDAIGRRFYTGVRLKF